VADREALAVIDWLDKPLDHARLLHAVGQACGTKAPEGQSLGNRDIHDRESW
jgi:hypothetical protein